MNARIAELVVMIQRLEGDLEIEMARRRQDLAYRVEEGKVRFEEHVLRYHKKLRRHWLQYLLGTRPSILLSAPIIYAMIIPFALLDLSVSVFQVVCFRIYRIPAVRRQDYLVFDRGHLAYLNGFEKFNCLFCSYANGVISFAREVAGRTEQYWCPIKHSRRILGAHARLPHLRRFWRCLCVSTGIIGVTQGRHAGRKFLGLSATWKFLSRRH